MDESRSHTVQLKVIIIGAGIGGLTAAIALRRQGHHVEVRANRPTPLLIQTDAVQIFETASAPSEVGAAINIVPNADSVLKRLGVDVASHGGVILSRVCFRCCAQRYVPTSVVE